MASHTLKPDPLLRFRRETVRTAVLLLVGVVLLPFVVYLVGQLMFGAYGGDGMVGFTADFWARLLRFEGAAWFLAFSPLLGISILRLIVLGWRGTVRDTG